MSSILAIGIATLDIINTVAEYPPEDTEIRAIQQRVCRGGNATNTLVVLSQLGHRCSWGGVCVESSEGRRILDDLAQFAIDIRPCKIISTGTVPTSYIVLNQRNGSRTIVHYRNLPEFGFADFEKIELSSFEWIHFEGRNVGETVKMLQRVRSCRPNLPISVEIEKPREGIEELFCYADILLFSKGFAQSQGYSDAPTFLRRMRQSYALNAWTLICAWGAEGGYALGRDGRLLHSPAYPPPQVIETLGAGDTFNAGIIDSLCRQQDLETALHHACRLAGDKCGRNNISIRN
jgi:ketohexokinase